MSHLLPHLQKLASASIDVPDQKGAERVALGAGALGGVGLYASRDALPSLITPLMDHATRVPAPDVSKDFYEAAVKAFGTSFRPDWTPKLQYVNRLGQAHYSPLLNHVAAAYDRGGYTLLHELGHATGRKGPKHLPTVLSVAPGLAQKMTFPVAGLAAVGAAMSEDRRAQAAFALAPAAISAPLLYEEARASIRGYKALKAMQRAGVQGLSRKAYLSQMLPAYGTYLAPPVLAAAGVAGVGAAANFLRERGRKLPPPE